MLRALFCCKDLFDLLDFPGPEQAAMVNPALQMAESPYHDTQKSDLTLYTCTVGKVRRQIYTLRPIGTATACKEFYNVCTQAEEEM